MKQLLQNPVVLKAVLTFLLIAMFAILGVILMKIARKRIAEESPTQRVSGENAGFSLAAYEGVITRLKEQERELEKLRRAESERAKESATVSEAIISNLPSGVLLFGRTAVVRQANPAARALLGYASPSGLHARDIFKNVSSVRFAGEPNDSATADALLSAIDSTIREGKQFRRLEAQYATPSGEKRTLGITVSGVRHPAGEVLGAVCLLTDLTDIARLSEQVKLQENMAALGEMSAGIAHEFKNSLATISGYAQMLQAEPEPPDFAKRIADETANLSRIVSDFLEFARPQGGARETLDLVALLEDCARESHVQLELTNQAGKADVAADPTALRQALSNLLRNSAEAAGGTGQVRAELANGSDSVRLTLTDASGGIASEHMSKIFIPFFTTKTSGTGLGLALVHRIVTEHGGSITVNSPVAGPGGRPGTAFTLTLPRSDRTEVPSRPGTAPE